MVLKNGKDQYYCFFIKLGFDFEFQNIRRYGQSSKIIGLTDNCSHSVQFENYFFVFLMAFSAVWVAR